MKKMILYITMFFFTPALSFAQDVGYGHMHKGWHMIMPYGYGGLAMWLLLIAVIGLVVYLVIQFSKGTGDGKRIHETALDILKKRYIRGEISKEEFEHMKQDLRD